MLSARLKHARRHERGMTLPIVAFLDVIFFMLMYFMAAGTLTPPEADLASAVASDRRGPGTGTDLSSQVLHVERAGGAVRMRLGDRVLGDRVAATALLRQLPKEPGVVVRAADDVTVDAAASAVQACRDAGFTRVSYVAGR